MAEALTLAMAITMKDDASPTLRKLQEQLDQLAQVAELAGTFFDTLAGDIDNAAKAAMEGEASFAELGESVAASGGPMMALFNTIATVGVDAIDSLGDAIEQTDIKVAEFTDAVGTMGNVIEESTTMAADGLRNVEAASTDAAVGLSEVGSASEIAAARLDLSTYSSAKISGVLERMRKAAIVSALAVTVIGYETVKSAANYQAGIASLAAHSQMGMQAAQSMGDSFLNSSDKVIFSADQIVNALAPVAGQLKFSSDSATANSQAVSIMSASMNLATANGGSLKNTTKDLADVMMVFGLNASQASEATNIMFNTSRALGLSTDQLSTSFSRMQPYIAGSGMQLKDMATLMVELGHVVGTGMQATRLAGTTIQSLISPSKTAQLALAQMGITVKDSSGKMLPFQNIISQFNSAMLRLPSSHLAASAAIKMYADQQQLATDKTETQTKSLKKTESALSAQISGYKAQAGELSKNTLLQDVFGNKAGIFAQILLNNAKGWNASASAVNQSNVVQKAAEERMKTVGGQLSILKASFSNLSVTIGQLLIPVVITLAGIFIPVINFVRYATQEVPALTWAFAVLAGAIALVYGALKAYEVLSETFSAIQTALKFAVGALTTVYQAQTSSIDGLMIGTQGAAEAEQALNASMEEGTVAAGSFGIAMDTIPFMALATGIGVAVSALAGLAIGFFNSSNDGESLAQSFRDVQSAAQGAESALLSFGDAAVTSDQARASLQSANQQEAAALSTYNQAVRNSGQNSSAAKNALDALNQAKLQQRQASLGVAQSIVNENQNISQLSKSTEDLYKKQQNSISVAKSSLLSDQILQKSKQQLATDQNNLNKALSSPAIVDWFNSLKATTDALKGDGNPQHQALYDLLHKIEQQKPGDALKTMNSALPGVQTVSDAITALQNQLNALGQTTVSPSVNFNIGSSLSSLISSLPSSGSKPIKKLPPGHAAGGLITSPEIALIGEAGPEVIIPLSNLPGGTGLVTGNTTVSPIRTGSPIAGGSARGGQVINVTVNMQGAMYGNINQFANDLGRVLATKIMPNSGTPLITT